MILNVSGRCDVVAFFSDWFFNRLQAGFLDVRNPYVPKQVKRLILTPQTVEAIVFCTKNPLPILPRLQELQPYPCLFQVTITPYGTDIEPHVLPKSKILNATIQLSKQLGSDHVIVRYDPIFISSTYSVAFHVKAFHSLCKRMQGYTEHIILSFLDLKKNTLRHEKDLQLLPNQEQYYEDLMFQFSKIGTEYGMQLQLCCEDYDFTQYGISNQGCINATFLQRITGISTTYLPGNLRKHCHCVKSIDVGVYNSCCHGCVYCYANFEEDLVLANKNAHDPNSSLLIGHLNPDDQLTMIDDIISHQLTLPL